MDPESSAVEETQPAAGPPAGTPEGKSPRRFRFASSIVLAVLVLALLLLSLLPWAGVTVQRIRGTLSARMDLRRGRLVIKASGPFAAWHAGYRKLLEERYGVTVDTSRGCRPSRSDAAFMESYNDVSGPAILDKYGKDVFKECRDEAQGLKPLQPDDEDGTCPGSEKKN